MKLDVIRFLAIFFSALALMPSGAHLAELPNKIGLQKFEYLVVQQAYRGWAWFGVVVLGALISLTMLTISVRRIRGAFAFAMTALACIVGTQIVFWVFTFPANQATYNWSTLPTNWADLRVRWEYSHAASAVLNLVALAAVIQSVLASKVEPMRKDRSRGV